MKNVPEINPDVARMEENIDVDNAKRLATQMERREKRTLLEWLYIISPFASLIGERPPSYLNPSITFFIVFSVVTASFYVIVASDGFLRVQGLVDFNLFNK